MSTDTTAGRTFRITTARRSEEAVTPLELFFGLVFVLAFTQCTALMADDPTWSGLAKGLLVLGVLWWSWVGYAWLTSVVDPEEDAVRTRDSYSILHLPMVAGIVLVALGMKKTLGDIEEPLELVPAAALLGGAAMYLLAHVAFRFETRSYGESRRRTRTELRHEG